MPRPCEVPRTPPPPSPPPRGVTKRGTGGRGRGGVGVVASRVHPAPCFAALSLSSHARASGPLRPSTRHAGAAFAASRPRGSRGGLLGLALAIRPPPPAGASGRLLRRRRVLLVRRGEQQGHLLRDEHVAGGQAARPGRYGAPPSLSCVHDTCRGGRGSTRTSSARLRRVACGSILVGVEGGGRASANGHGWASRTDRHARGMEPWKDVASARMRVGVRMQV